MKRFLHLGVILPQPGQLRPDSSNSYGLDALVSNVNTYAVTLIDLSQSGTNITLTGQQALAGVVRLVGTASNNFTVTLPPTARLIDALGPTVPRDGSYAVEISIQNEDTTFNATLTAGDSATTINGTSIVVAGTRRIWLMTVGTPYDYNVVSIQNIGTFSTTAISPTGGTVTSVGQTVPVEFTVSGSPVTSAGVLAIDKANETANTVWAGPTSGSAAQPTFRALVLADLPGGVGSGSVTSVGLTAPAEFTVSGSPVTTSGTLVITKATESANTVWAGPTTGAPAQPAFRALVAADLPASLSLSQTFATIDDESATLANSRRLVAGTNVTFTDGGAGSTLTIAATGGSGGTLQSQVFTSSATFTVPASVTAVWVTMIGGGGGGAGSTTSQGGGGGGSGEVAESFLVPVVASSSCAVTIGAAGAGGTATNPGAAGGSTSFNNNTFVFAVGGGNGGGGGGNLSNAGLGGGSVGGAASTMGSASSPNHFSGGGGGMGGHTGGTGVNGGTGAGAPGALTGGAGGTASGANNGGGGGASTIWGVGGAGGNASTGGTAAVSTCYGAGGGGGGQGATGQAGANGAGGRLEVYWIG